MGKPRGPLFGKIEAGWHTHPKTMGVSMAARGMWAAAISYCRLHETDGWIPVEHVGPVLCIGDTACDPMALAFELVDAGYFDVVSAVSARTDSDIRGHADIVGFEFLGWSEHQLAGATLEQRREKDRLRKQRARSQDSLESSQFDGVSAPRPRVSARTGSDVRGQGTDLDLDLDLEKHTSATAEAVDRPDANNWQTRTDGTWPDARDLCDLLADCLETQGCKRPTITEKWVNDMRKTIDIDGRTRTQIEDCLRWIFEGGGSFWAANIQSPAKLRAQFDQMRLQARRGREVRKSETATIAEQIMGRPLTLADLKPVPRPRPLELTE